MRHQRLNEKIIEEIFSREGRLSSLLASFDFRKQQGEMAINIYRSLSDGTPLLIEAPPGVGKSLAYLVPLVLWTNESEENRAVVTTGTRTLQDQIVNHDALLLQGLLPDQEIRLKSLYGNQNYACERRLENILQKPHDYLEGNLLKYAEPLKKWQQHNALKFRKNFPGSIPKEIWSILQRDPESCSMQKCIESNCTYAREKIQAQKASIVVVNHYLFLTDLIYAASRVIGKYNALVADECHLLDDTATRIMGQQVSRQGVLHLLSQLVNPKNKRGLLYRVGIKLKAIEVFAEDIEFIRKEWDLAFDSVLTESKLIRGEKNQRGNANFSKQTEIRLIDRANDLQRLSLAIKEQLKSHELEEEEEEDIDSAINRLKQISRKIISWVKKTDPEMAYYIEGDAGGTLMSSALSADQILKSELFNEIQRTVLVSGTLAIKKNDFSFFKSRLGLSQMSEEGILKEICYDSPFDYKKQSYLFIPEKAPDPRDEKEFRKYVNRAMMGISIALKGRTLCLFTSFNHLLQAAENFRAAGIKPYIQGEMASEKLIREFIKDPSRPILAVQTFWMGVDFPEGALRAVCIAKLPFDSPGDPKTKAICDRIDSKKSADGKRGNSFADYMMPKTILMLRQGFGRLIRSQKHYGAVCILDPRIKTRRYGKLFLKSLPDSTQIHSYDKLIDILKGFPSESSARNGEADFEETL